MNALQRFTLPEKVTAVAGIVLLIGMFAFPGDHVGIASFTVGGQTFGGEGLDSNVPKGPGSFVSLVARIVPIPLLAEFLNSRLTAPHPPALPIPWSRRDVYRAVP